MHQEDREQAARRCVPISAWPRVLLTLTREGRLQEEKKKNANSRLSSVAAEVQTFPGCQEFGTVEPKSLLVAVSAPVHSSVAQLHFSVALK